MSREWKPGDVAYIPGPGRALLLETGEWVTQMRGRKHDAESFGAFLDVRPLVTIDPESREDVERLADEIHHVRVGHRYGNCYPDEYDEVQAALRNLAADPKPPRIAEPGLWGVVEASCVHAPRRLHWMRHEDNWWPFAPYWMEDRRPLPDDWDSLIDPVLIREGVQS